MRLIREPQVREKLGSPSRQTAYARFYNRPDFPKPAMRLHYNLWLEDDIDAFLVKISKDANAA
jgi:predicted DNA-binding transcriptional regulator AlpA